MTPSRPILSALAAASAAKAPSPTVAALVDRDALAIIDRIEAVWPDLDAADLDADAEPARYERLWGERRAILDAAERLPATTRLAVLAKALGLAWVEFYAVWERGRARDDYATDGRLALDIQAGMMCPRGLAGGEA